MSSLLKIGAATVLAGVVGYCIYFDYKRTSHPDYKENVRIRLLQIAEYCVQKCS